MAISQAVELGTGSAGDGLTVSIVTAVDVPAGSCIVVTAVNSGSGPSPSCSDNAGTGNTYTRVQTAANGTTVAVAVWIAFNASMPAGTTISVGAGNTTGGTAAGAVFYEGVEAAQADALDQFAGNSGSSTTPTTATVTTLHPDEVIVAALGTTGDVAVNAPVAHVDYPFAHVPVNSAGSYVRLDMAPYRLVTATGSYAASATIATSRSWAGVIITLKAVPPPLTTYRPTSTIAAGGWTTTAASLHAALSDQSDLTIITGSGI